jgi:hypothetical protein
LLVLPAQLLLATVVLAQGTTSQATATCNFDANNQVVVEYQRFSVNSNKPVLGHEIPYGRVWAPGGKPMTLFRNSPIAVAGHDIPAGAYTLLVIPSQKEWTLVICKSADTSGRYDEKDDFLRVAMDFGQLDRAEDQFSIFFAHVAPGQCSMRLDLEKARAWVIFEKR